MATEIIMPKFGMTQETAEIVSWLVKEGQTVSQGDPIAEVTTDKVNMEVEAPTDGILGGLRYQVGDVVPVTEIIAYLLQPGEQAPAAPSKTTPTPPPAQPEAVQATPVAPASTPLTAQADKAFSATPVARRMAEVEGVDLRAVTPSGTDGKITRQDVERFMAQSPAPSAAGGKVRATPAARRIAREQGLDLAVIDGSGPHGRVQATDVSSYQPPAATPLMPASPTPASTGAVQQIPLVGMRKTIANRLQASYQQAPHIMFTVSVDMTEAIALRQLANQRQPSGAGKISMTALIVKACAWALRQQPLMNSHLVDDTIYLQPAVNIGVAVALDEGLIVPVVPHADQLGLAALGAAIDDVAARARQNKLRAADLSGGTFTVSNLGMYGIDHFTAILNPPEVGILAVGQTRKQFVPDENDQPILRPMMTMTLSADHRVIDGAVAAQFIASIKTALSNPLAMLL